jgi:heptosyltransferase-2
MTGAAAPRVVVVKLAALGDLVMASTLVHAVRTRWPQAHLTWVTGAPLVPLAQRLEGIDRVVPVDTQALLAGGLAHRARAMAQAWWRVGRTPYDLGVVAHTDPRYALLLQGARVRTVRHFRVTPPRRGEYMGAAYARLVGEGEAAVQLALLRLADDELMLGADARGAVLLAPGGARNVLRDDALRRWPLGQWVQLARALRDRGERVLLVGGAGDAAEAEAIAGQVPGVENLVGRTSLVALMALVAQARLLVCHDSGPMHLAALTRTPTVALFGPTAPAERMAPGVPMVAVSAAAGLPCAPCYDGREYARCSNNRCLGEVPVARVLAAAGELLGAAGSGPAAGTA